MSGAYTEVEFLANNPSTVHQAERVIAVELPKHRSCMHLDTVMTHIDVDTFSDLEVVRKRRPVLDAHRMAAATCARTGSNFCAIEKGRFVRFLSVC